LKSTYSASWRHLIDFSDPDETLWVHPGGQSGHPASKHYQDLIPLWAEGRYARLSWKRDRVEAEAEARLDLVPSTLDLGTPGSSTEKKS
jgi:penicillin amidase